jgi:hypothetical protein
MKRLILLFGVVAGFSAFLILSPILAADDPVVMVQGPTIVAFFPPVTKTELENDAEINEELADFQLYATRLHEPLKNSGIEFRAFYTRSFRVCAANYTVLKFRPRKGIGYLFFVPGKKLRVEYGVLTDADVLVIANEYFGARVAR